MAVRKPGPGWKFLANNFFPDALTFDDFLGARAVVAVFKILSWGALIGTAIAAYETGRALHDNGFSNTAVGGTVAGIVIAGIVAASALAFFAYVIELLVAIHYDVRLQESARAANEILDELGIAAPNNQGAEAVSEGAFQAQRRPVWLYVMVGFFAVVVSATILVSVL